MTFDAQWHSRNERRFARIEHQNAQILELLRGLTQGEEFIMSQQDEINATAAQEEQDIASINASQASFVATAKAQLDAITALQQQIAQNPTQPVSSLDLSQITQSASDLHNAAQALASAATTESADVPSTPSTPTDTGGGTPAASPDQPVYTFSGDGTPADPAWTPAPFTTSDGKQLYFFGSDSPGSAANGNGVDGVWAVYDVSQGVNPAEAPSTNPSAPGGDTPASPTTPTDTGTTPTDTTDPTDTPVNEPTPTDTTGSGTTV